MTREEAIKRLEVHKKFMDSRGVKTKDAIDMAIEALQAKVEWIPVSERLPSEHGEYLVFYEGLPIIGYRIEIMWYGEPLMPNVDVSGKHFYRCDSEWGDIIYDEVIAWMPLPEPYRKDGEE